MEFFNAPAPRLPFWLFSPIPSLCRLSFFTPNIVIAAGEKLGDNFFFKFCLPLPYMVLFSAQPPY